MVLEAPRHLVRHGFAIPDVGDDGAILRVEACGLCGTDHEQFTGTLPAGFAFVPGHETVGVIEAVGTRAAERWDVAVGDRVAVEVFQSCRSCAACRSGQHQRCAAHGIGDMYGFIPVERAPGLWGGYATHQYLAPDTLVLEVPEGMDPVTATLFNPLGAGFRWGVDVAGTVPGDVVAVLGCGVRGLATLVAAREAGAAYVLVTGSGPRDAPRLELARRFGADLAVDVEQRDPVAALRRETGRLADVVVDVTAKAPSALGQAVEMATAGGTVVVAGTRGSPATPGFRPDDVVFKELRVQGALGVTTDAYRRALDLLASGRYPFDEIPRRTVGLGGAADLLATMAGEAAGPPPVHGVVVP
jgi:alcohol dehydrogenase